MLLDVLKGHVDDGHHHVDKDHVHNDGKDKEEPRSALAGSPEGGEVELADAHGERVLDGEGEGVEVLQVRAEDEVEEAAEGSKHNDELHHKG